MTYSPISSDHDDDYYDETDDFRDEDYVDEKQSWYEYVEDDTTRYRLDVRYTQKCLRAGNFSSAALDPDEYFGIFETKAWIEGGYEIRDDDGDETWLDTSDIPDHVISAAIDHFEND